MNKTPQVANDADPSSISIGEARKRISRALPMIGDVETVQVCHAVGRTLGDDIIAPTDVPPFRASAMDGYAFRHSESGNTLRISATSTAGHPGPDKLGQNECHRITTGARIPDDADTVVMQENTQRHGENIQIHTIPVAGLNVRQPGSDSARHGVLLNAKEPLRASEMALLSAHGITEIPVLRKLKVAVLSTGDELVDAGNVLDTGQIHDANRTLLLSLLQHPAFDTHDLGICEDTPEALQQALMNAEDADVVISSGGVSVGDADHVRPVLEARGKIELWKIAMKPGRPLTFGFSAPGQPFFGLPGNPVSSAMTCLLFVLPALREMLGQPHAELPMINARSQVPLSKLPGRVEYQRGILTRDADSNWCVDTTGMQDSHMLSSLHKANCVIELSCESSGAAAGDTVNTIPFAHFSEPIV